MVDFKKLRNSSKKQNVIDPREIFRRLPKPEGINDLYASQAEVLDQWYARRSERDVVLKLHTGGGKTLVGLLIAQSAMNERGRPIFYLCSNNLLVDQTLEKAALYGIPAEKYIKKQDFSTDFYDGRSVAIGTYDSMFNGLSRFGVKGQRPPKDIGTVIVDDAHVALSTIRDQFTLQIDERESEEMSARYYQLASIFRFDFEKIGKQGTFDDVVSTGIKNSTAAVVLEVPYWAWLSRIQEVKQILSNASDEFKWQWPFLRDHLPYCHCFIARGKLAITPILPLVDMIPSFSECPHRVYMSATISDDSAVIRAFDASPEAVNTPLVSKSLAGISERMILTPETMGFNADPKKLVIEFAEVVRSEFNGGSLILVGSGTAAEQWKSDAIYPDTSEEVSRTLDAMKNRRLNKPVVLANRYDGIDLPGNTCRLLVIENKPSGFSLYDLFRAMSFAGGEAVDSEMAQRFEQGAGRGARGASDYCVVLLLGKDLIGWISRRQNQGFLTAASRAQFEIGKSVSADIHSQYELLETIRKCLKRERDWVEYHAESLAEMTSSIEIDIGSQGTAGLERKAFRLHRASSTEKAVSLLRRGAESTSDVRMKGWLLQMAARFIFQWGNAELSEELQREAYSYNENLLKPLIVSPYIPLQMPGKQADEIVKMISKFSIRKGLITAFDYSASFLVSGASSNQFEQALAELGEYIGFAAERPDNKLDIGPDVMWITSEKSAIIFEAKSRKEKKNAVSKGDHGQLLNAEEWFKENYKGFSFIRVLVPDDELGMQVQRSIEAASLTAKSIGKKYLPHQK